MGDWLYQNLRLFSERDTDPGMAEEKRAVAYYDYDVYMGVSDYNRLREMLGLAPVTLRRTGITGRIIYWSCRTGNWRK